MRQINWNYTLLGLVSIILTSEAEGAAFRLRETNGAGVGRAMAGEAAAPDSGSAANQFDNAAALGFLEKSTAEVSAVYIKTKAKFSQQSATNPASVGATALNAGNGRDGGGNFVVPAAYLAWKASKSWTLGFGFTMPFGLRTEYSKDWVGKSHAIVSDLKTYNLNPAVSWRINDKIAVGGGFNFQYIDAELSRHLNVGVAPNIVNADATVKGHSWGYGGNIGVLVAPTSTTKIGLAWRTSVEQKLKGDIHYNGSTNPAGMRLAGIALDGSKARATIKLPDIVTLSGSWDINKAWRLLGTVEWTRWSTLKELRLKFPENNASDVVETFSYKDSLFYSLGAVYQHNACWKFKAGIAYDQTPTKVEHRSPRIPDEDRVWFALGTDYSWTDRLKLSVNYAYVYVRDVDIDLKTTTDRQSPEFTKGTLKGKFKADSHLVGARLTYRF